MFKNLKSDIKRYYCNEKISLKELMRLFFCQEIWAVTVYRFGFWVHHSFKIPVIHFMLKVIAFLLFKINETILGITIPFSVKIGEGFYIGHFGRIIINTNVKIGKNCTLGSGVVIGTRGLGDRGIPAIGDNVFIGVGAKILGGVKIGNNARIGANAVVLSDVPDSATAVGIPARIIGTQDK